MTEKARQTRKDKENKEKLRQRVKGRRVYAEAESWKKKSFTLVVACRDGENRDMGASHGKTSMNGTGWWVNQTRI
jgi:hypothetical protein